MRTNKKEIILPTDNINFAKEFANTDKKVRDAAVRALRKYLTDNPNLDESTLLKLWKGLFYCMWMCDKQVVQAHLTEQLAQLTFQFETPEESLAYLAAFWKTIILEWHGIDRLRLNKFYFLLRHFHRVTFTLLENHKWEKDIIDQYIAMLRQGPLNPTDHKVPKSLQYHTSEVLMTELEAAVTDEVPEDVWIQLLQPLIYLIKETNDFAVFKRVMEECFSSFLNIDEEEEKDGESSTEKEKRKVCVNPQKLGKVLFEVGSDSTCPEKRRKVLYNFYKLTNGSTNGKRRLEINVEREQAKRRKKCRKHKQLVK